MLRCSSQVALDPTTESEATLKFLSSLNELRELRSQIHNAADSCESAFKTAHDKTTVIDDTREYICRAVVSVVDHVGCVSANLNSTISECDTLSEADLRISCLKQKVSLHGEYNHSVVMSSWLCPRVVPPRHFSRYLLPPPPISNEDMPEEQSRRREAESCVNEDDDSICTKKNKAAEQRIDEELPLFVYTSTANNLRFPLYRSPSMSAADFNTLQTFTSSVLPVCDGLSVPRESKRFPFHFQTVRKHGRKILLWRIHEKDFLSLFRRHKKDSLKFLK